MVVEEMDREGRGRRRTKPNKGAKRPKDRVEEVQKVRHLPALQKFTDGL